MCKKFNAILIFDEIQTCFGRTGKLFCFQKYNITPDILCIAKGMKESGKLYAVDTSEEFTSIAKKYWKKAGLDKKILLKIDKGLNFLDECIKGNNNNFDFSLLMCCFQLKYLIF